MLLPDKEFWKQNLGNKEKKVSLSGGLISTCAIKGGPGIKRCVARVSGDGIFGPLSLSLIKN